ncbi:MAG: hypothetical protein WC254_02200 [Candidatus Woesearchaeota archaeon]|jgi:hypothetical protein
MNQKAMEPMIMVSLILGIVLLGVAAFAFVPKTIDTSTDFINNKLIDLGLKTEETPTIVIDEERISEGTSILINGLDGEEGLYTIIKQEYGTGWDLEYKREFCTITNEISEDLPDNFNNLSLDDKKVILGLLVLNGKIDQTDYMLIVWICKGNIAPEKIEDKPLLEILSSDNFIGTITISGRTYAHIINTADTNPETPDLTWCVDTDNDGKYTEGKDISKTPSEINVLLLNDLYQEATS